ncbi:hypothetical protein [Aggregatibacter actinomycetemcomitans]|uniref:hypothetical protein n=1 Tax=Aggregatibacter actinomycetemcomitans TaxID=714 RepID=UPI0011D3C2FB|nr:hypothetical protein [Aggregatibacter actinomycetemcomitans]TYA48463.1 hypothetical protein FXB74_09875 [Aggregatibacter actinomycetemcomitans]
MKTLKIKFNLIEKVKGRDFLLRQEWLERECQEVHEISFSEYEGRKALEDKLNLDICGVLKTTLEKNKDRLRTGTHYITATVKLEEDNKDVGFVIRHFDQTLHAIKEVELLEGVENDFDIFNLSSILNNFSLFTANEEREFFARYLVPKGYKVQE